MRQRWQQFGKLAGALQESQLWNWSGVEWNGVDTLCGRLQFGADLVAVLRFVCLNLRPK